MLYIPPLHYLFFFQSENILLFLSLGVCFYAFSHWRVDLRGVFCFLFLYLLCVLFCFVLTQGWRLRKHKEVKGVNWEMLFFF